MERQMYVCMNGWMSRQMSDEWMGRWTDVLIYDWVDKWMDESVGSRVGIYMSPWISTRMDGSIDAWLVGMGTDGWLGGCVSECIDGQMGRIAPLYFFPRLMIIHFWWLYFPQPLVNNERTSLSRNSKTIYISALQWHFEKPSELILLPPITPVKAWK